MTTLTWQTCIQVCVVLDGLDKAHHSTETTLLRMYNDILFNIDKGNGTLLVLLVLAAAFDTIDHQFLFHILEH